MAARHDWDVPQSYEAEVVSIAHLYARDLEDAPLREVAQVVNKLRKMVSFFNLRE